MKVRNLGVVILRYLAAIILVQTLYFKFTAHPESVYIFSQVGMEPWGRYLVGVLELVAAVLLVVAKVYWIGGLLAMGLMAGAIFMHLTSLGIEVQDDNGYLFFLAVTVFLASLLTVLDKKNEIPILKRLF